MDECDAHEEDHDEHVDHEEVLREEAVENECDDLGVNEQNVVTEERASDNNMYKSTSGRSFRRQNDKYINKDNMQMNQFKKIVKNNNPGVPAKKLNRKLNKARNKLRQSSFKDIYMSLTRAMFSQISKEGKFANTSLKEGMKRYVNTSIEALLVELFQLDNMTAFNPLMFNELNKKEKKMALNLLVVMREKRYGKIKDRVVADGSNQRSTVPKEDATFPTIQLESLIMPLLIKSS